MMDGWMDGWMDDGWMDGWTDGWTDGWMDEEITGQQRDKIGGSRGRHICQPFHPVLTPAV